jgi:hypothetical protein
MPPVLWQHSEPIGPLLGMQEDERGLLVRGSLLVDDVARAREARALLQAKAIRGMSIGYIARDTDHDVDQGITKIKEIDLWEVSIVTFPANRDAQVDAVKQFGDRLPGVREFEDFLRDAGGFSRAQAKTIAAHGYGRLLRDADRQNDGKLDVRSLLSEIGKEKYFDILMEMRHE